MKHSSLTWHGDIVHREVIIICRHVGSMIGDLGSLFALFWRYLYVPSQVLPCNCDYMRENPCHDFTPEYSDNLAIWCSQNLRTWKLLFRGEECVWRCCNRAWLAWCLILSQCCVVGLSAIFQRQTWISAFALCSTPPTQQTNNTTNLLYSRHSSLQACNMPVAVPSIALPPWNSSP